MERGALINLVQQTGCATERGGFYFPCDPHWGATERAAVGALWEQIGSSAVEKDGGAGWLCLPTGGTSGGVRFARHDEATLGEAVAGFCEFFDLARVNAVDVLPAYHVSGFMARVRCAATGGLHVASDWRRVERGERPVLDPRAGAWVISLVPTQLQRLLASPAAIGWLRGFQTIFIGGGPVWPELTETAAALGLPVALSYGMTETAAMVAAIKPGEFLNGERTGAAVLPHVTLSISECSTICIEGASVFRGYFPELRKTQRFETGDAGAIDERGRLRVFGRKDAVIITGGKKVHPLEVEAALQATGQFSDVAVVGVVDTEWGERVVACFPNDETTPPDLTVVERGLENSLASYKRPKRYVAIAPWPRNAQGKLNRVELARRASAD